MEILKCIFTKNDCYKAGRKIKPAGIMVHSTGANNPNLRRYVAPDDGVLGENVNSNDWNRTGLSVCVHGFIGRDKDGKVRVYQTLPWNMRGWHAGGAANNTHISFEICEDGLNDAGYFKEVYKKAAELCAYLCREYGLTERDIICHSEGYKKGIASNHGDVMHWFPKFGKDMDDFREDVRKLLAGEETTSASGGTAKAEKTKSTSKTALTVDGVIGKNTVRALQTYLKTVTDGFIDGQYRDYMKYWSSIDDAICKWSGGNSMMVAVLQKHIGAKSDGILGRETAKALQKYLSDRGFPCGDAGADGRFGRESARALQRFLNKN